MPNIQGEEHNLNDLRLRQGKQLDAFDNEPIAGTDFEPQSPATAIGLATESPMAQSATAISPAPRSTGRPKKGEFPWDDITAREAKTKMNQHFSIPLTTEMKIDWIKERVPQMTRAKFMRQAVEKAADDMVAYLRRKGIE